MRLSQTESHFLRLSAMFVCIALNSASNSLFTSGGWLAGGGEDLRDIPSFYCLSIYALAPNTFLPPFMFLFEAFGEPLLSLANPMLRSSLMFLCGVTDVIKALVERIPSLMPSLVFIDKELGSLRRPPGWPNVDIPKLSPLTKAAIRTYLCVNLALLVSVAIFS